MKNLTEEKIVGMRFDTRGKMDWLEIRTSLRPVKEIKSRETKKKNEAKKEKKKKAADKKKKKTEAKKKKEDAVIKDMDE